MDTATMSRENVEVVRGLIEAFSSAETSTGRVGYVCTLRDSTIVRIQDYPDPAEALEAAGLGG